MKIIMKTALLFAVLCCALLHESSAGPKASGSANRICCFGKGSNSKIPLKRLQSYYWTSSTCPLNHIVFITTAKRHLCMNPNNEWVQNTMKDMDMKPGSKSSV